MARLRVFVGLDYHASGVQVCVLDRDGAVLVNRMCPNHAGAIAALVHRHGAAVAAAVESCCGAADLADELVTRFGWSVDLAHPGYVRRMKQNPDKTDYTDARMLADLERVGYLPRVWQAPAEVRALRDVVRYRQQLAQQRRSAKLRVRAVLRQHRVFGPADAAPWSARWVAWLTHAAPLAEQARWVVDQLLAELAALAARIQQAEDRLAALTAADPVVQFLVSLKGIGLVTAVTLRAEIGRFDRFRSGKQLAKFCGLSPRNASSGERQADAGLIKAGNPQLRSALVEAAHRLARFDPRWARLKAGLKDRGKAGSLAAAAVANRWVRWLYHPVPVVLAA